MPCPRAPPSPVQAHAGPHVFCSFISPSLTRCHILPSACKPGDERLRAAGQEEEGQERRVGVVRLRAHPAYGVYTWMS